VGSLFLSRFEIVKDRVFGLHTVMDSLSPEVDPIPPAKSLFHCQMVRPAPSASISGDEEIIAYVVQTLAPLTSCTRETAGHAKVVEGPKVWDMAGCKEDIYGKISETSSPMAYECTYIQYMYPVPLGSHSREAIEFILGVCYKDIGGNGRVVYMQQTFCQRVIREQEWIADGAVH
jgi:hypothetical protein